MLTAIGDVMRRVYERGWITTRDGSISMRKKRGTYLYITPSGWRKPIVHPAISWGSTLSRIRSLARWFPTCVMGRSPRVNRECTGIINAARRIRERSSMSIRHMWSQPSMQGLIFRSSALSFRKSPATHASDRPSKRFRRCLGNWRMQLLPE